MNAAAIAILVEKGLDAASILEVALALEQRRDPTAAERQRRCRDRKRDKSQRDVTRDTPPIEDIHTPPVPFANANGAENGADQIFWAAAKSFLRPHSTGDPGKMVGKWIREQGKPATIAAIASAQAERAADPVQFIQGIFRRQGRDEGPPC